MNDNFRNDFIIQLEIDRENSNNPWYKRMFAWGYYPMTSIYMSLLSVPTPELVNYVDRYIGQVPINQVMPLLYSIKTRYPDDYYAIILALEILCIRQQPYRGLKCGKSGKKTRKRRKTKTNRKTNRKSSNSI